MMQEDGLVYMDAGQAVQTRAQLPPQPLEMGATSPFLSNYPVKCDEGIEAG